MRRRVKRGRTIVMNRDLRSIAEGHLISACVLVAVEAEIHKVGREMVGSSCVRVPLGVRHIVGLEISWRRSLIGMVKARTALESEVSWLRADLTWLVSVLHSSEVVVGPALSIGTTTTS